MVRQKRNPRIWLIALKPNVRHPDPEVSGRGICTNKEIAQVLVSAHTNAGLKPLLAYERGFFLSSVIKVIPAEAGIWIVITGMFL